MGDVFGSVVAQNRAYFEGAALHAGYELGLFDALPCDRGTLAGRLGVDPSRLRALVTVLVGQGAILETESGLRRGAPKPPPAAPIRAGWGRLAAVLRSGEPATDELDDAELARRYQAHLLATGAPAAEEIAREHLVPAKHLLDAGGGSGAYARAFLQAGAGAVTLIDRPEIIPIARETLRPWAERVALLAGDLLQLELAARFDRVLLSNVLHLHDAEGCAQLLARCAAALAPGGTLVVKDLRPDTEVGRLFALNMALYTQGGSVWSADRIATWLRAAGLEAGGVHFLRASPDSMVVFGGKAG